MWLSILQIWMFSALEKLQYTLIISNPLVIFFNKIFPNIKEGYVWRKKSVGRLISWEMGRNIRTQTKPQRMVGTVFRVSVPFLRRSKSLTRKTLTQKRISLWVCTKIPCGFYSLDLQGSVPQRRMTFLECPISVGILPTTRCAAVICL